MQLISISYCLLLFPFFVLCQGTTSVATSSVPETTDTFDDFCDPLCLVDCFEAHEATGCDDGCIQNQVCLTIQSCCIEEWAIICSNLAGVVNATGRCIGNFDTPLNNMTDCLGVDITVEPGCNDSCLQSYTCNGAGSDCCTNGWLDGCADIAVDFINVCAAGNEGLCVLPTGTSETFQTTEDTTGITRYTRTTYYETGTVLFIYIYKHFT